MRRVWPMIVKRLHTALAIGALSLALAACASQGGTEQTSAPADPEAARAVDDNIIKLALNRRLIDDGLGVFKDVIIVVFHGRVLLIGSVDEPDSLERAADLAWQVEGVADVINHIQVNGKGGIGAFISDVVIEKSIQSAYLFEEGIDSAHFRVRSVNGVVYLIGEAANQAEYDRASALASETDDVKRVVNYVVLAPE